MDWNIYMEEDVINFVTEMTGVQASDITRDTLVNDELGIDGDDGREFLIEFSERFKVDLSPITCIYFGPEVINPITIIFSGVTALLSGFFGKPDHINPLSVRQLVLSAEARCWVNV